LVVAIIVFRRQIGTFIGFSKIAPHISHSKTIGKDLDGKTTFESALFKQLRELETSDSDINTDYFIGDSLKEIHAAVPKGKPIDWIIWHLCSATKHTSYKTTECYSSNNANARIRFESRDSLNPVILLKLSRSSRYHSNSAKMAFFIQDFGFEANKTTTDFLSFPEPLTVGLIPSKRLASWTAQIANEYRKEIIIQIPMEPIPRSYAEYSKNTIKLHYSEQKLRMQLSEAMQSIPNFAGFSNFFGSKVLEDTRVMTIVFSELKDHYGFFIESESPRKSVTKMVAKKVGVPFETVHVTIDSIATQQQIQDTLHHFAITALKTGKILIASKPSSTLIAALNESLPDLNQWGIRLVYVSEIVKHP